MKRYLFLFIIIFFSSFFYACPDCNPVSKKCSVNSDCSVDYACYDGYCDLDICKTDNRCGSGKCITGSDIKDNTQNKKVICICDEKFSYYKGTCVPVCNNSFMGCRAFDEMRGEYGYCNMELGHCDKICKGEESCGEGYFCSNDGKCEPVNGYCKTDEDCTINGNPVCNTYTGLCMPHKWYCFNEMDCFYYEKESGRTYCDQSINKCLLYDGWCEEDDDCRGNAVKTVCNIDNSICEKPSDKTPKEVFIDTYSESLCQKYFECNPDIDYSLYSEAYRTMEDCKNGTASKLNQILNSEVCSIYDDNFSSQVVTCTDNYVCSSITEGLDEGFSDCFYQYFMDICSDGNGKNEAAMEMGRVYCENMFNCDEEMALQRYRDLSDCKIKVSNDAYTGLVYDNICPDFDKTLFAEYIDCLDNLTCEQNQNECQNEFNSACNNQ